MKSQHLKTDSAFCVLTLCVLAVLTLANCRGGSSTQTPQPGTNAVGEPVMTDITDTKTCTGDPVPGATVYAKWYSKQKGANGLITTNELEINATGVAVLTTTCVRNGHGAQVWVSIPATTTKDSITFNDAQSGSATFADFTCKASTTNTVYAYKLVGSCLLVTQTGLKPYFLVPTP
jgi:hypothetical protein